MEVEKVVVNLKEPNNAHVTDAEVRQIIRDIVKGLTEHPRPTVWKSDEVWTKTGDVLVIAVIDPPEVTQIRIEVYRIESESEWVPLPKV